MVNVLEQDEIDDIIKKYNSPQILENTSVYSSKESKDNKPLIRSYQQTFPILYANEKEPKYYGIETIYEQYDSNTNKWYLMYKTGRVIEIRN